MEFATELIIRMLPMYSKLSNASQRSEIKTIRDEAQRHKIKSVG